LKIKKKTFSLKHQIFTHILKKEKKLSISVNDASVGLTVILKGDKSGASWEPVSIKVQGSIKV